MNALEGVVCPPSADDVRTMDYLGGQCHAAGPQETALTEVKDASYASFLKVAAFKEKHPDSSGCFLNGLSL
jgi:hypothetical protein